MHLEVVLGFNAFATVMQVFKRFPLLHPFQYLAAPIAKLKALSAMEAAVREGVLKRIDRRGKTEHVDLFDYVLPIGQPVPKNPRELIHTGALAQQMMFANFGPMSDWYYGTLLFLVEEPDCQRFLSQEIRSMFQKYEDLTPPALASLPYLNACLQETLRVLPGNNTGLARYSPGAMIDGRFVPKGTHVQTSIFAFSRSSRFFRDPLRYRPQRWLSPEHSLYDSAFADDDLKGFYPFSLGPRSCIGREMGWMEARLFIAKVLWTFDIAKIPGQSFELEESLLHYGFLDKPELRVTFLPASVTK